MDDYIKIPSPGFRSKKKPASTKLAPMPKKKPAPAPATPTPAPVAKVTAPAPAPKKFGVTTLSDYAEAMKRTNKDLEAFERANTSPASNNKKVKK